MKEAFPDDGTDASVTNPEITKELTELRESRPTPVARRWRPKTAKKEEPVERSKSAHVLHRVRLPDDSWVMERSSSRLEEERRKAVEELQEVKRVRTMSSESQQSALSKVEDNIKVKISQENQ